MEQPSSQQPAPGTRRIALVTPWSWSVPHPVNDHVRELAGGIASLRAEDPSAPDVVIIAASSSVPARRATRRALRDLALGADATEVLARPALGVGCPGDTVVPLLALGLPLGRAGVALRSNLTLALEHGGFDLLVVHDPLESDLSRVAVRRFSGITVGAFHELPPRTALQALGATARERLAEALDVITIAHADERVALAGLVGREPADILVFDDAPTRAAVHVSDATVDGAQSTRRIVLGRGRGDDALVGRALRDLRGTIEADPLIEAVSLSRWEPAHRPSVPRWLRGRLRTVQPTTRDAADVVLARSAAYIAFPGTHRRAIDEARANGVPVLHAGGDGYLPAQVGALLDAGADSHAATLFPTPAKLARALLDLARPAFEQRRHVPAPLRLGTRTHRIDMHMHTNHSYDCGVDPEALMFAARKAGLSAICVTDHNEVSGALVCAELADEYGVEVIVGEEVMTAAGEVIGLFLTERVEPNLSWDETLERIHAQDGLVYVPHPFDRMHTIPDISTLRASLDEIDIFETCNGRLAFEQYNRDAARFARKYNLVEGAGSDAHVLPGLASATVSLPAWDGPETLLRSLRQGEIERRPSSYLYVQTLKRLDHLTGKVGSGGGSGED